MPFCQKLLLSIFPSSPILHYSFNLIRPSFLPSPPHFPSSISLMSFHLPFLKLAQAVAISAYINYSYNIRGFNPYRTNVENRVSS